MAAPDPFAVRMYRNTVKRHRTAAITEAERIAEAATQLVGQLQNGEPDTGEARRIQQMASQLDRRIAALDALRDVEFTTDDQDAEEA